MPSDRASSDPPSSIVAIASMDPRWPLEPPDSEPNGRSDPASNTFATGDRATEVTTASMDGTYSTFSVNDSSDDDTPPESLLRPPDATSVYGSTASTEKDSDGAARRSMMYRTS